MRTIAMIGALVVVAAAPLSAQGKFRTGDINPSSRFPTTGAGTVLGREQGETRKGKSDRVPPGQLPPDGMCRIWIDGVPPGQQPAPTDCQTAVATKPANARVIWGRDTAFPGRGKGKFNKQKSDKSDKHKIKRDGRDHDDDDDDRFDNTIFGDRKSVARRGRKG